MGRSGGGWRYPRAFWVANAIELFERAAYYGTFIALAVFLTEVSGWTDVEAGWIGASFAGLVYLLPFATGAVADRTGFRPSLVLAFAFLATGYAWLGVSPGKSSGLLALGLIAVGGAFVKPIVAGTVSRCSDVANRARAFSLFYMIVNIGSFAGKSVAGPVRKALGVSAVPLYSAGAAAIALALVALFYRPPRSGGEPLRSLRDTAAGLRAVARDARFLALILITAGFWIVQGQMYASMPKYVLRMVGDGATPEWYANVNPLVVVLAVVPVTHLMRRLSPVASIGIALGLVPVAAGTMAASSPLGRWSAAAGLPVHPVTAAMVAGIAIQGLAECFLSPRYLEYASKLAPRGREGLYLGYAHLNMFVAWFVGFVLSGYLLEAFCPDPASLGEADRLQRLAAVAGRGPMPGAYAHAPALWAVFAGVGAAAFAALVIFRLRTRED